MDKKIDQLKTDREAIINQYRINGKLDENKVNTFEQNLNSIVESSKGKMLASALFELATIQRIRGQFDTAIQTYERAIEVAKQENYTVVEFDAWIGIARAYAYNSTPDHGAAAAAFEQAVAVAGDSPTQKQRYDMADYASQLQSGRGELEAALLNALDAIKLTQDDSQKFYAYLDTGDALQKFAESCDYRKLIDAKSQSESDSWGACKRAVAAAKFYYLYAKDTAHKIGWSALEKQAEGFYSSLDMRLYLINQKASLDTLNQTTVFAAQDVSDVIVNEDFSAGGSELEGTPIGAMIDEVLPESKVEDPRSLYLLGIKADMDKKPEIALEYYKQAAKLLGSERATMFDLRQRGTVTENRPELIRDLGIRLLKLGQFDDAFLVFESMRSQGLGSIAAAFSQFDFTDDERAWIANVLQLESLVSAKQTTLVETTIAGIEHSRSAELLESIDEIEEKRREMMQQVKYQSVREKIASVKNALPSMSRLEKSVKKSNIPVLLYWVTHTNVVVWVVSPVGTEVKTVFLPEVAVVDKVSRFLDSVKTKDKDFDEKTAKELFAYLIKPFSKYLSEKQVIIIPQGPLVGLPFEALMDAENGKFLAEIQSVSYAPNADFAIQVLEGSIPKMSELAAIYDEAIDLLTQEISKIKTLEKIKVDVQTTKGIDGAELIKKLSSAKNVHVLLHGTYNYDDPLQSEILLSEQAIPQTKVTAAQLLAVNWKNKELAVFSSCEGALVKTRISNEQFGISWTLLAGGVDHVLLSRWRVKATSNAAWMESFYQNLVNEKVSPALAANAAMRKMINSAQRHPYYWAGPQVFGK